MRVAVSSWEDEGGLLMEGMHERLMHRNASKAGTLASLSLESDPNRNSASGTGHLAGRSAFLKVSSVRQPLGTSKAFI